MHFFAKINNIHLIFSDLGNWCRGRS